MTASDPGQPISILFWSEPNPFRNSYTEHLHMAQSLLPPLIKAVNAGDALLRLFSNDEMIDRLIINLPESSFALQRPTNDEAHVIAGLFGLWNDAAIDNWLNLVRGKGDITEIYVKILERLHAEQPIDVIVTWSENGAIRNFSKTQGIPVLFGELGPTRAPFPQTMYFDPEGTNGHAAYRRQVRAIIEAAEPGSFLPATTWLVTNERGNLKQETEASLVDIGLTYRPEDAKNLPDRPYLYVPLQLADDLNTLLHSDFSSPVDFLRSVSEMAKKGDYTLVVKGHPGVKERPYNMRREIEALDWLEEHDPEALILPRDCGPNLSAYAMANAAYTVSINSSVGFESMILGVPPLVLGQAAYDADGWLQENIPLLPADAPRNFGTQLDALVSVHMEHVLVPREIALDGDYLLRRMQALVAGGDQPLESFFHSDWHVGGLQAGAEAPLRLPRTPALGKWNIHAQAQLTLTPDMAIFTDARRTLEQTVPLREEFTGFIDTVEEDSPGNYHLTAWALDTKTMRPPLMLLLLEGDKVKSRHRVTIKRPDVHAAFPNLVATPTCGFKFGFSTKNLSDVRLMLLAHDGTGHFLPPVGSGVPILQQQAAEVPALGKWNIPAHAQLTLASDMAIFTDARRTLEQTVPLREEFTGFIDTVEEDSPGNYHLTAWVLDTKTMRPPLMVLLLEGDKVKSRHQVTRDRPDVQAAFPGLVAPPTCGFKFGFSTKNLSDVRLMLLAHDGTGYFLPSVGSGVRIGQRKAKAKGIA